MRRANGYHILSLLFAGLGSLAWSQADSYGVEFRGLASALWLASACAGIAGTRKIRREREDFVRQLRRAAAAIQSVETVHPQAPVKADALAAAVEGLIAASRAQTSRLLSRLQELEIELQRDDIARHRAGRIAAGRVEQGRLHPGMERAGMVHQLPPARPALASPPRLPPTRSRTPPTR